MVLLLLPLKADKLGGKETDLNRLELHVIVIVIVIVMAALVLPMKQDQEEQEEKPQKLPSLAARPRDQDVAEEEKENLVVMEIPPESVADPRLITALV